jgi:hypothetical protein
VIVVSGCINDVSLKRVVRPWGAGDFGESKAIQKDCGPDLALLLRKITGNTRLFERNRTKIVALAYFPILSPSLSTRLNIGLPWLDSLFHSWANTTPAEIALAHATAKLQAKSKAQALANECGYGTMPCNAKHHAYLFDGDSKPRIQSTVASLNDAQIIYVYPGIDEAHAAYATKSPETAWIWEAGFKNHGGLAAIDDARANRTATACHNDNFCAVASMGHPNRCGEVVYAQSIINALGLTYTVAMPKPCAVVPKDVSPAI